MDLYYNYHGQVCLLFPFIIWNTKQGFNEQISNYKKKKDLVPKVLTGKRELRPLLEEYCTLVDQFDIKTG